MDSSEQATGALPADPTKPSLAYLPYEIQSAIFETAGSKPQLIFMDLTFNVLKFSRPAEQALNGICQLSRQIYLKDRQLFQFGNQKIWVDPDRDIFYFRDYQKYFRTFDLLSRRDPNDFPPPPPAGDKFDLDAVRNVGIYIEQLSNDPRQETITRLWSIFPAMKGLHIMIPRGGPPRRTMAGDLSWTPENMVLSTVPSNQVIASPGSNDKELWLALRYQVKRMCGKILAVGNRWTGREVPEVFGHFCSVLGAEEDGVVEENEHRPGTEEGRKEEGYCDGDDGHEEGGVGVDGSV